VLKLCPLSKAKTLMLKLIKHRGKKFWLLTTILVGGLAIVIQSGSMALPRAEAGGVTGGPYYRVRLSSNRSSALANGSDAITFTATAYYNECNVGHSDRPRYEDSEKFCDDYGGIKGEYTGEYYYNKNIKINISVTGSGNILSAKQVVTGSNGKASFTLKSKVAGSKTVTAKIHASASKTVTFKTPEPDPPAPPTVGEIKVGTQVVKTGQTVEMEYDQRLTLSGKTVAKGIVKLYVFSKPKTETVKADNKGNWSYNIQGLEAGKHRVEAEVTDPATDKTSKRKELLKFTVLAAQTPVTAPVNDQSSDPSTPIWIWPAVGVGLVMAGAGSYFGWRWWRKRALKTHGEDFKAADNTPDKPIGPTTKES
jgi:hypothetical protein